MAALPVGWVCMSPPGACGVLLPSSSEFAAGQGPRVRVQPWEPSFSLWGLLFCCFSRAARAFQGQGCFTLLCSTHWQQQHHTGMAGSQACSSSLHKCMLSF